MSLNFKPKTAKVEFEGGDITVRGLSIADLVVVFQTHREGMELAFNKFANSEATEIDAGEAILSIIPAAPVMAAHVIALAASMDEEEGAIESIMDLPVYAQLQILTVIGEMTFAMQGGMGNVAGIAKAVGQAMQKNLPSS